MSYRSKVDKKAMIKNRYNPISYLAPTSKRERDTYSLDDTKIKTAQVKSQGDSSFPTDGHKAKPLWCKRSTSDLLITRNDVVILWFKDQVNSYGHVETVS